MTDFEFLTTREVATILDVDQATVNRMAKDGRLPTAMKGPGLRGSRWFLRTQVEDFAARRRHSSAAS